MKLNDIEELKSVVGSGFRIYSSVVASGRGLPVFLPFLQGVNSVNVTVSLSEHGVITITPIAEVSEVVESIAPIESPVLEATDEVTEPCLEAIITTEVIEKPKRKRKE
jgi:hypothetical protein